MTILSWFWRGWAIEALFGETAPRERTWLSVLVGTVVVWPMLVIGIAVPKVAVQVLSFVPLPDSVPSWIVRLVWVGLAFLIPLVVGFVVAAKAERPHRVKAYLGHVIRGFPITLGLALSFGLIFVSVPVMRLAALVRRQSSADIPLIMNASAYHQTAAAVCQVLNRQGFSFRSATPGWWVSAPIHLLTRLGGDVLRPHVPYHLEHFVAGDLRLSLYPSGLLLRGKSDRLSWARGLIAEAVVHTDGLQTTHSQAQTLERRLRSLWKPYDNRPSSGRHESNQCEGDLRDELDSITHDLRTLNFGWDDWQILYRQTLQLDRAAHGEPQLLDREPSRSGGTCSAPPRADAPLGTARPT